MATKKEQESKKEYTKAKPFSQAGRMRASKVAMGTLKGPVQSVRAKGQTARDERKAAGDQKRAMTQKSRTKAHESKQKKPPGKTPPKPPLKK